MPARLRSILADTRPLQHPDFRRLWFAYIITTIGAQLTVVSVPAQIWAITRDSGYVGLTGLFGLVPLVVFGLWGGAIADAFDRRLVLLVSTLGLIVLQFLFAAQAFFEWHNVWVILGLFAVQQAFFGLTSPARMAILPALVPRELLPAANALNTTVMTFGGIAGPLVGGMLIPVLGFALLYFVDGLFLLATLYAVMKLPPMPPMASDSGARRSVGMRSIAEGLRYTLANRIILMSFVVDLIAMIFGMPRILIPQMADVDFGGPIEGGWRLAVLFAAMPAGAFLGGVLSGWVSRVERQGRAVTVAIVVWGLTMVGMGFAVWQAQGRIWPWLWVAVLFFALGGAADMASASFRQTMLLTAATDEVRGRIQGVFLVVVVGGPRIADLIHGRPAASIGAGPTTMWGGALVVAGTILAVALVPAFWRYRTNSPARVSQD
ncbi:MFS transporter [Aestuariimicrobium sp. p3-SID1156]|uniref:MFS transporter n=1 Tax=Aestuariimicrobium sp. p3-SID1156 TaxID=2916038 RepID=UPI00223C27A5|nr:MFS transporter [Aestuariimicrobium sp. p3-SID1156]MCT1459263.1 MFS transporter [Aestuariimicrobium sp. p3-SID1156]